VKPVRPWASLALAAGTLAACPRQPDGLDEQRAACRDLIERKQVKDGLGLEQCAQQLHAAAVAQDPARKAEEVVQRFAAQALASQGSSDPGQRQDLGDAAFAVERLGRPAVAPLRARLSGSGDPAVRREVARLLVRICWNDCREQKLDCVVPALLELLGPDLPPQAPPLGPAQQQPEEQRAEALTRLANCTGRELGQDPAAWRAFWASRSPAR
jgi:hypothetical protein